MPSHSCSCLALGSLHTSYFLATTALSLCAYHQEFLIRWCQQNRPFAQPAELELLSVHNPEGLHGTKCLPVPFLAESFRKVCCREEGNVQDLFN